MAIADHGGRLVWRFIGGFACCVPVLFLAAHLRADMTVLWPQLGLIVLLGALSLFYRRWRPDVYIAEGANVAAQALAIMLVGGLAQYPLAVWGGAFAYRDDMLLRADVFVGFDWFAYLAYANSHAAVATLLHNAYSVWRFQFVVVLLALVARGRFKDLYAFSLALFFAGICTDLISCLMPARGYYVASHVDVGAYAHLHPSVLEDAALATLEILRTRIGVWVDVQDILGLISFPSFHAASSILFAWATRHVRYINAVMWVVSAVVVASTPIEGAHYLVDVVAGLAVAAGAATVAWRLLKNAGTPHGGRPFVPAA